MASGQHSIASYFSSSTESSQLTDPCDEVDSDTSSESMVSSGSAFQEGVTTIHGELPLRLKAKRTCHSALTHHCTHRVSGFDSA